ncbi:MAG: hypothetical protein LJE93_00450 [Acidobacteria bacterium]|nr:hypothetical protein [Acidobacteriota bacterium]
MSTSRKVLLIAFSLLLGLSSPGVARQTDPGTVEQELHALGLRSGEVVILLRKLVSQREQEQQLQRLQVAVLALQLRSDAIGEIEARIRTLGDRVAAAKEELAQLEAEKESVEAIANRESTPDAEREHLSSMQTMFEAQIDMIEERIWLVERQIVDLENELAAKRRDVNALEEIVMEGLGEL